MYSEVAKNFINIILSAGGTIDAISDMYEINAGDKKVLLEHAKALRNIFDKAIEELENEVK